MSAIYRRPEAAQTMTRIDAMLQSDFSKCKKMNGTTPSAGNALPQFSSTVQQYTTPDVFANTIVCSGTVLVIGETIGIAVNDEKAGTTNASYIVEAERILVPLTSAGTVTRGADVFLDPASNLFTHDGTVSGAIFAGKFIDSAETASPAGLPAGNGWCAINFYQTVKA